MAPLGRKWNGSICPQIHKEQERRREIELQVKQRAISEADLGRQAFGALSARRENLTPTDREVIARNLAAAASTPDPMAQNQKNSFAFPMPQKQKPPSVFADGGFVST